jgi:asparagine synthetase B (glutamine-hydrolysing)
MLKRRGPEGFTEQYTDLGYFAHSMLTTIGTNTPQPYQTKFGTLLYNGSTYNSGGENDTQWIGQRLDDKLDNTLDVVRELTGEYAFIYVTDRHVVFCVDHFDSRNLWFYHDAETRQLTIASIPSVVEQKHKMTWRADGNKIYVIDRHNFSVDIQVNKIWNFDQNVNHFDLVFENFERAISDRYNPDTSTNLLSSGFDSGVINCATHKIFKKVDCVSDPDKEIVSTIKERMEVHGAVILPNYGENQKDIETMFHSIMPIDKIWGDPSVNGLVNLMKKYVSKRNKKIVITGNGGDEIYNDWQGQKSGLVWTKTNGSFPSHLQFVWGYHNHNGRMQLTNTRTDFIAGYYGLEARNPLIDVNLVQAWINTKSKLKNRYKSWMKAYMEEHDYPYTMKKVHSWSEPYVPEDWKITKQSNNKKYVS